MALSGDGRTLVTGAQDNTLRLWDVPQPRPVLLMAGHRGAAGRSRSVGWSSSHLWCGLDKAVRLWDVGNVVWSVTAKKLSLPPAVILLRSGHRAAVLTAAWRNDAACFATADADGRKIVVWSPFLDAPQKSAGTSAASRARIPEQQSAACQRWRRQVVRFWQLPIAPVAETPYTA